MTKEMFTAQELAEMAAYDAEIDGDDALTDDEILSADSRDKRARRTTSDAKAVARDAKDIDYVRAYRREYYQRNKERIKERVRAYWAEKGHEYNARRDREVVNARARAYYAAHKEEIAARRKAKRDEDPEATRAYWREYHRKKKTKQAAVVQGQGAGFPSRECGFDSRPPLHDRSGQGTSQSGA